MTLILCDLVDHRLRMLGDSVALVEQSAPITRAEKVQYLKGADVVIGIAGDWPLYNGHNWHQQDRWLADWMKTCCAVRPRGVALALAKALREYRHPSHRPESAPFVKGGSFLVAGLRRGRPYVYDVGGQSRSPNDYRIDPTVTRIEITDAPIVRGIADDWWDLGSKLRLAAPPTDTRDRMERVMNRFLDLVAQDQQIDRADIRYWSESTRQLARPTGL